MVSVVMPAYNSERFLAESVGSVTAQTFENWELLIVNDASVDGTSAIAERLAGRDPRIRVIHLDENRGVANARNEGMNAAKGQYLAFLDSDDLWLPKKLETQLGFMRQKDIAFSFTSYRAFGPNGNVGGSIRIPDAVEYEDLLKGNVIGCLTVMIDRDRIAPFAMPNIGHEDYAAWLQILRAGHVAYGLQEDLARYRVSSGSVSGNKKRCAAWTWNIYRQREQMPLSKAVRCFAQYSIRGVFKHFAK